jgi:exonuclease SbcC
VRITRLELHNFRVFADLDLAVPDGVVGIFGPNGSGKSTLVEAITWALFGVARTGKDALRADGSDGECRVTVGFDHDGHLYEVTRALTGNTLNVSAEAACDGLRLAAGATSVRQYVHQVLGMSADAFRASVCCEQKQVDAFSGRRPEERRRLVLDLLGITPLDKARDAARGRARAATEAVEAARLVLGDLDALAAEVATLEAGHRQAAGALSTAEEQSAAAAQLTAQAEARASAAEAARLERERLRARWEEANRRRQDLAARLVAHESERQTLADAARRLPALEAQAAGLEAARAHLHALEALEAARAREVAARGAARDAEPHGAGAGGTVGAEEKAAGRGAGGADAAVVAADEEAACRVREAGEALGRVRGCEAALAGAEARRQAARAEAKSAAGLDPEAPCPLCGQELGTSFEDVVAARAHVLEEADADCRRAVAELDAARTEQQAAERRAAEAEATRATAAARAEQLVAIRMELESSRLAMAEAQAALAAANGGDESGGDATAQRRAVADCQAARDEALRLAERLARTEALEAEIAAVQATFADTDAEVAGLVEQGRALAFDPGVHAEAVAAAGDARAAAEQAREAVVDARLAERGLAERLAERRLRLEDERRRRGELDGHENEARHLGRLAELLGEFRNSLVGQVGPALSAHTTALFRELTDARFDSLEVDPDTFELRIGAAGGGHPLDRHSGSETDLANLSLRIAIGEQVNLLSGGQVGMLVLDEVLGSLDAEHRDRLLAALTRLAGRFSQVFVVTHATEVKERLPQAIEVVPLARGRATARLTASILRLVEAG